MGFSKSIDGKGEEIRAVGAAKRRRAEKREEDFGP